MIRCRLGLHWLTREVYRSGWVGFNHVRRYKCACGKYVWIQYNGTFVERSRAE